jgi:hypothetical protein
LWNAAIALESHEAPGFEAFDHRVVWTPGLAVWAHDDELARAVADGDLKDCRLIHTEIQF